MHDNYMAAWEQEHAHWNNLGKSMSTEMRELDNKEVAKLREDLPFGPPSPQLVEKLAAEMSLFPISVFRIWAGLTFKRSSAFPKGHPMKLNINAQQRERDQLRHLDIEAIGQLQNWRCVYCEVTLTGKYSPLSEGRRYQRDHIVPLASGGRTEQSNIQLTCSTCNQRKNSRQPNQLLTDYMDRKVTKDILVAACQEIIPHIVESLIWADSLDANCPWCNCPALLVSKPYLPSSPSAFQCKSCGRVFRTSNWEGLEDFYQNLSYAMRGSWYAGETALSIIKAVQIGELPIVRELISKEAGDIAELRKRRHQHSKRSCWCEFGGDEFEVVGTYTQSNFLPYS